MRGYLPQLHQLRIAELLRQLRLLRAFGFALLVVMVDIVSFVWGVEVREENVWR